MKKAAFTAALCLGVAACGGGSSGIASGGSGSGSSGGQSGGSDPVVGLTLPEKLSVLAAKQESGGVPATKPQNAVDKSGFSSTLAKSGFSFKVYSDADTAYSTDTADTYVYDPSMESLNTINEIVCYMSQTAASEMVNEGPYIALINEERCRQGQNGGSTQQTGQSSASNSTEYARWTIESTREDNDSPQHVRLWVPPDGNGGEGGDPMDAQSILVDVTVSEGVSDSLPFGSFSMNFKGVADGELLGQPGVEVETMKGMLATVDNAADEPQFRFINVGGDSLGTGLDVGFGFEQSANARLGDADGTSGLARTRNIENWSFDGPSGPEQGESSETYAIDYDSQHFLADRQRTGDAAGEEQVCRSRDEFDVQVWRYNLYFSEDGEFRGEPVTGGDRVDLETGFPFSYDSDDDGVADTYGWIDYYGIWTESNEVPEDGQTIERFDWDTDQTTDYTVRVGPGRLTRRSANEELLSAFIGDRFEYWGQHPTLDIPGDWMVEVNQNLGFSIVSTIEWGDNGPEYSETIDNDNDPQTDEVPVAADLALGNNDVIWLWSQALGGNVVYTQNDSVAADARTIKFYAQEYVYAADDTLFPGGTTETALYCYDQCLIGGLTQNDVDAAQDVSELYHVYEGAPFGYTLASVDGKVVLTDDANGEVVSATTLDLSKFGNDWGINTGEMLTERLSDPSSPWLVYDSDVSYRWESGPNPWNVVITATDLTGAPVDFDRPLEFQYVHSTANDANDSSEYDGKRFMLQYGGAGDLHGFPWIEDENSTRWYAAVTLADGVILSSGDQDFVVKAVEKEQSMREVDASACVGLDAGAALADSSLALPVAGDIGTVDFALADRPTVTGPPAVIEGEVQGTDNQ